MGDHRLPNGVRRLEEEHTQCGLMAKLEEDGSGCRRCVQVGVMVSPLKSLDDEKMVYEVHDQQPSRECKGRTLSFNPKSQYHCFDLQ